MCWSINHSQVNVTDRRFAFSATNRMNFDNINGIPLFFPALIHSALFSLRCPQNAGVPLVIKLSPNVLAHLSKAEREKEGRREEKRGEPNYFSLFHCQVINKT